jgi:AcrR family transcriptional regulator
MFARSHVPLSVWFAAIHELNRRPGIDADALATRLGITTSRARRVRERVVTEARAGGGDLLRDIADTVASWDRRAARPDETARASEQDPTRAKILDATVQVIVARGYSAVRVSDIAAEAGVSPATVHYHFETKDELLFAALGNTMAEWFAEEFIGEELSPIKKLGSALRHAIVTSRDRVDQIVWMDFSRLAMRDARWAAKVEDMCLRWDDRLRAIIREGVETGDFNPIGSVDDAVMRIQGLIDGLAERVMLAYSDSPGDRVRRLVVESAAIELRVDRDQLMSAVGKEES